MGPLTVWCVSLHGKYPDYFVQRLRREVFKHLSFKHRFICISDHEIDYVDTRDSPTDFRGWWAKLGLFKPGVAYPGTNLFLDLDVVITGSLDPIVSEYRDAVIAAPMNWAQSGHGGIQSSVMVFRQADMLDRIYREFDPSWAHWPAVNRKGVYWGDQEYISAIRDAGKIEVTLINPAWVKSYKYHVQKTHTVPDDCRVVVFHGKPDPDEVAEDWFQW